MTYATEAERREAKRISAQKWRRNNPEVVAAKKRRYRARKAEVAGLPPPQVRGTRGAYQQLPAIQLPPPRPRSESRGRGKMERRLLTGARNRARLSGREFDLDLSDVVIPTHCPILGIELYSEAGQGCGDHSPTLDRVDNARGYIKGNVCVISGRANRLKRDASLAELQALVKYVEAHLTPTAGGSISEP